MPADAVYLVAGIALLVAVVLPVALDRVSVSVPMVLVLVGVLVGFLPMPEGTNLDPVDIRPTIEHVAELTVLIALMGVGLALDRPLSLRRLGTWRRWSATWRLLLIAMPLTIAGVYLVGAVALGVAPAAALLLGAALAPTDPVLASDVQVEGPTADSASGEEDEPDGPDDPDDLDEGDEVRFALTSEAGLNDGLAFPFVYAAVFLASKGDPTQWALRWVAWELVGKVAIGVVAGVVVGWVLGRLAFQSRAQSLRMAENGEPLLALAAILSAYGAAELAGGYGFLAVFACAMTMRSLERRSVYHQHMHAVVERLERILVLLVLLMIGIQLTRGLLDHLDWRGVALGLALIFVIRPLSAAIALRVGIGHDDECGDLDWRERGVVAFFGVRGVGSIYYLAYALGQANFPEQRWLWSTVAFTIVVSVVVHGVAARRSMAWIEQHRASISSAT